MMHVFQRAPLIAIVVTVKLAVAAFCPFAAAANITVTSIACFDDERLVGLAGSTLLKRHGDQWVHAFTANGLRLFGNVPGRVFVSDGDNIREFDRNLLEIAKWSLPLPAPIGPTIQLVSGQLMMVTRREIFALREDGSVAPAVAIPQHKIGFRPAQAPFLFKTATGELSCFSQSMMKEFDMRSHCVSGWPAKYFYPVDFGPEGPTAPFLCGDVVVSSKSGTTQARLLADGRAVGRRPGAALWGSGCLGDNQMFWVGKRSVAIFDLPKFRKLKEVPLREAPTSAAVCGNSLKVLVGKASNIVTVALPDRTSPTGRK